jgi:phage shock protein C
MYCNYCGKQIQDDAVVCAYCGIRVGASMARMRLVRPRMGRKVAGVCLGFSEYFDIDVTVVRLVWLITAIMTCIGFLLRDCVDRDAGRTLFASRADECSAREFSADECSAVTSG